MSWKLSILTAVTIAFIAVPAEARISRRVIEREVERFGEASMAQWQGAPGMGVCVVRRGERPIVAGFGFADRETNRGVDEDTIFYHASFTKPFTALALLQLAARGEIDLDAPLSTLAPDVALPEPLSMQRLTLRRLLTHTGGFTNEPISVRTAFTGEHTPSEIWRLWSQYTAPREGGEAYSYTNLGYIMSTYAVQQRSGADWRALLDREVLRPMRLTGILSRLDASNPPADLAMPYEFGGESVERAPLRKQTENMHAAGGTFSTVGDACRFVQMMIEGGRVGRRQVFDAAIITSMTTPQVEMDQNFYQTHREHYGFGWYLADYDGVRMAQAHGGFTGYRAHASFLPEHGIGVVVFINENSPYGANQPDYVANHLYDFALERPDLSARDAARNDLLRTDRERLTQRLSAMLQQVRIADSFALPNEAYVGTYVNDGFGTIRISLRNGGLYAQIGLAAGGALRPGGGQVAWTYFEQNHIPSGRLTFTTDEAGHVTGISYSGATYTRR